MVSEAMDEFTNFEVPSVNNVSNIAIAVIMDNSENDGVRHEMKSASVFHEMFRNLEVSIF